MRHRLPGSAPLAPAGGADRPLSVTEAVKAAAGVLAKNFEDVRVEGELSGVRYYSSGHCYFTLKDEGAALKGVMFSTWAARLRFRLEDGLKVVVRGSLAIYVPRGDFQVVARSIEPKGVGDMALAYEQLRAKLEAEGLFEPGRKRPIPMLPSVVGVVTSKEGAALQDVLRVLQVRHAGLRVAVADARVQGEGAAAEIVRAIRLLNDWGVPEVLIVGRGGGSAEDLWAFNEEPVVRAIAESRIPVISAVGHEVDVTLSDFAADRRAATPSNAAEIVVAARADLLRRVASSRARIVQSLRGRLARWRGDWVRLHRSEGLAGFPGRMAEGRRRLDVASRRLGQAPRGALERLARRLASAAASIRGWPATLALEEKRRRVGSNGERLATAARRRLDTSRGRVAAAAGRLDALSPLAVLSRGYAIAFTDRPGEPPRAILRPGDVATGESIRVRLHEGELGARVVRRSGDRAPETRGLFGDDDAEN